MNIFNLVGGIIMLLFAGLLWFDDIRDWFYQFGLSAILGALGIMLIISAFK